MEVDGAVEVLFEADDGRVGADPGKRGLHRFLHDIADLAGHRESSLALHAIGFDK